MACCCAGPRGAIQAGSFAFLCLHAAVAMQPVASTTHSVLLTSGTLSPMEPLLAELGLDGSSLPQEAASRTQRHLGQPGAFPAASAAASPGPSTDAAQGSASARPGQPGPLLGSPGGPSGRSAAAAAGSGSRAGQPHQGLPQQQQQRSAAVRRASGPVPRTRLYFSSPHHSSLQGNLLALSISHVPRAGGVVKLNSGFQHRGSPEYLNGLGSVLLAACAPVPHGVLFFFPSWGLLHAATAQWKLSGGLAGPLTSVGAAWTGPTGPAGAAGPGSCGCRSVLQTSAGVRPFPPPCLDCLSLFTGLRLDGLLSCLLPEVAQCSGCPCCRAVRDHPGPQDSCDRGAGNRGGF